MRSSKRYLAGVEQAKLAVAVGDYVRLEGCRPQSKNKHFKAR
jgi:ribosomal protein S17